MRKNLMPIPGIFVMPLVLIATYSDDKTADLMPAAWARICGVNKVALSLGTERKTLMNIMLREAFTLSFANAQYMKEMDFLGTTSAYSMPDKLAKAGFHFVKSKHVDAPIISEFPVAIECELEDIKDEFGEKRVKGKIINVNADTEILDSEGKIDVSKLDALMFEQYRNCYYVVGQKIGKAFEMGKELLN